MKKLNKKSSRRGQNKSQQEGFQLQKVSQVEDPAMSYQMSGIRDLNIRSQRAKGLSFHGKSSQFGAFTTKRNPSCLRPFRPQLNNVQQEQRVEKSNSSIGRRIKKTNFIYSSMDLQPSTSIFKKGSKLQKSTNLYNSSNDNLFEYGMENKIKRIKEAHRVLQKKCQNSFFALKIKQQQISYMTQQLKNQLKFYQQLIEKLQRTNFVQCDKNSRQDSHGSEETETQQVPSKIYGLTFQI